MSKFAAQLTHWFSRGWVITAAFTLILSFYFVPWLTAGSTSMTYGAYDLAEWASLHPSVRFSPTPLIETLMLRLPPVLWASALAFSVSHPRFSRVWWFIALVVLLTFAALLPPFEFLSNRDDPNYQQQFQLAVAALIGGGVGLSGILKPLRKPLSAALIVGLIGVGVYGFISTQQLYTAFAVNVRPEIGIYGFVMAGMLGLVSLVADMLKNKQRATR